MTDDSKRQLIVPRGAQLATRSTSSVPVLPPLPAGNSMWITERGRYQRDATTVNAHANFLQARVAQADACLALIKKREQLLLAIASLADLPEKVAHQRELGRLSRLSELRMAVLQQQLDETNAQIEVAAAAARLALYAPAPEPPPAPAPIPPPPVPTGLTPEDIRKAAQRLPDISPEALETLVMLVTAVQAEKKA